MDSMNVDDDLIEDKDWLIMIKMQMKIAGKWSSLLLPRSTHLSACLFWGLARDDSFGVGAPIFVGGNSFATGVPGHGNAS